MAIRLCTWLIILLFFPVTASLAEPVISAEPALPLITRGQEVEVHGKDFPPPDQKGEYVVFLNSGKGERIPLPAKWVDANTFSFTLPTDKNTLPADRYLVSVRMAGKEYPVPGDLRVLPDVSAPVHLDAIYPITAYPTRRAGSDFEIIGQNLAALPQDNMIIVVGRGPIPVGDAAECEEAKRTGDYKKTCIFVDPGMETRKLHVVNFPRGKYDGPVSLQVQVGNNLSNALPLTLSRVSELGALISALTAFLVIMAIVVRLVWKGLGTHTIADKRYGPWRSFFLDKETNTYSLSKFQLLVWTSVFVFGYVYVFLCRILIQWKFDMPPVPDNMPGLLAISAGATVASAGVTETRGSKGAGPVHPSAADFISTGGLVVGERFQFFVWTLVGAFQFIAMLLLSDPSTLMKLPDIPTSFLYLMGVSSAGYLAGKLVRKPGPVIRSFTITPIIPSPVKITVKLQGENLSKDATVSVDGIALESNRFEVRGSKQQDQAADPSFYSELYVDLLGNADYLKGEHTLNLVNRDGQSAAISFRAHAPTIDQVEDVEHGLSPVAMHAKGKNFSSGMTAKWRDAAGNEKALTAEQVTVKGDGEVEVTVVPGEATGTGTLTLMDATGAIASKQVNVT